MEVTAGIFFKASFDLENEKYLAAEKMRILGIIVTFIYGNNNTALLICRICRFGNRKEKCSKNSLQNLQVIFSGYGQTHK